MIISQHPTHHLNLCLHDPSLYCPDLVTRLRDGGRRRGRLLPRAQSNHSRFQCGKFQVKFLTHQQQLQRMLENIRKTKLTPFFNHLSMTPPTDHIWFYFEFFSNYFGIYFYYYYFQILEPQSISILDQRYQSYHLVLKYGYSIVFLECRSPAKIPSIIIFVRTARSKQKPPNIENRKQLKKDCFDSNRTLQWRNYKFLCVFRQLFLGPALVCIKPEVKYFGSFFLISFG